MTERVHIRRLPTGVSGLDEVLGGGLPEFSFNLIAGAPGTGKTTLVHQIMFAFEISDHGIVVGARVANYQGLLSGSPQLIPSASPVPRPPAKRRPRS